MMNETPKIKRYTVYAKWTKEMGGTTELIGETEHKNGVDMLLLRFRGRAADVYCYDDTSGEITLLREAQP